MELTERFADAIVHRPFALDEACILIGAHGDPRCDVEGTLHQLDALAGSVPSPSLDDLLTTLFGVCGFAGDRETFYDPRNSYLHEVLDRRSGIPVTLAVVLIEIGRRLGVVIEGIGTPAHFMARAPGEPRLHGDTDVYVDAFGGGRTMDRSELEVHFRAIAPGIDLEPHLVALSGPDIVRRILGNLVAIHRRSGDRDALLWSTQLRTLVPGSSADDHRTFGGALAACGDFVRAAKVLESLVDEGQASDPQRELDQARRLRARLN